MENNASQDYIESDLTKPSQATEAEKRSEGRRSREQENAETSFSSSVVVLFVVKS